MALPLPRVVADVEPGGPFVTALRGINALRGDILQNKIRDAQAKFAPLSALADASSKLAYSSLTGPQFLAKILGNSDVLANLSEDQKRQALNAIYAAGSGQQSPNQLLNLAMQQQKPNNSLSDFLTNKIKNIFSQEQAEQPMLQQLQDQYQQPNLLSDQTQLSSSDKNAIGNLRPGDSYVIGSSSRNNNDDINPSSSMGLGSNYPKGKSFAENAADFQKVKNQGIETGKIIAKDVDDFGDTYKAALNSQVTLDSLNKVVASPVFQSIRQLPIGQQHQLSWYSKFGTPEQQELIGKFKADTGRIVQDGSQYFRGQFRVGEQKLLESMKVNDNDSPFVAVGKLESLNLFNRMMLERSRIAGNLQDELHLTRVKALEKADKLIDTDAIKKDIKNKLNPMVTIRNKKTGETMTISVDDAMKKYGIIQ